MANPIITDVRAIWTAPAGIGVGVVKVSTNEPELYGLGCCTFTYRHEVVSMLVDNYLKPLLVGRDATMIEDIWQLMHINAYWRSGPIENNAISGVDMALWDIKGKMANMPIYQLLGGKCREGAQVYRHAGGDSPEKVLESVHKFMDQGIRHIRIQQGGYGGKVVDGFKPENAQKGVYYDPDSYMRETVTMFEYVRKHIGDDIELLHDAHERLHPIEAVRFAKMLEPYRLFFLEDLLSPEQGEWWRMIRQNCTTPLAQGELFTNPREWYDLIKDRLIDFIRVHISCIGGITPARKLAIYCEQFGVRTAFHGPGDVSPIGHAANVHLDLASHNFGIQEWCGFGDTIKEVFPGMPELRGNYAYVSEKPGFGVDLNEELAAKFPVTRNITTWTQTRMPDGTIYHP